MNWYRNYITAMPTVWGRMASGIMFRYNGKILLQLRSHSVEDGGVWGIPGGALKGTEGYYDSKRLPAPTIDERKLRNLFDSAIMEVEEEFGFVPDISEEQYKKSQKIQNKIDNFVYVTFIVDLTEDQMQQIEDNMGQECDLCNEDDEEPEAQTHEWFEQKKTPEKIHPGVKYVLDRAN